MPLTSTPGPAPLAPTMASKGLMRVPTRSRAPGCVGGPPATGKGPSLAILAPEASAALRNGLLAELAGVCGADAAARWARDTLAVKNTLTAPDARLIEDAFALRLASAEPEEAAVNATVSSPDALTGAIAGQQAPQPPGPEPSKPPDGGLDVALGPGGIDKSALPIGAARRHRDKAHLKFVASQPCLVCGRRPVDPHHVRFAQKRALGRKVSDEFTVPLCRSHHRELHRSGDEFRWWDNAGIDPLKTARKLWKRTRSVRTSGIALRRRHDGATATAAVTPAQADARVGTGDAGASLQDPEIDRP
jgi:hypothetical protein